MKAFLIIIVLIVLLMVQMVVKNRKTPAGLGINDGNLAPMPKRPNAVSSQSDDPEKKVEPITFEGDINKAKQMVKNALNAYGNINIVKEDENYLYAVSTTEKMKYNDDIEFYFIEDQHIIHFRSSSRVGYSDRGLNRERYNKLIELMK